MFGAGIVVKWIPGNHDTDTPEACDRLWGDYPTATCKPVGSRRPTCRSPGLAASSRRRSGTRTSPALCSSAPKPKLGVALWCKRVSAGVRQTPLRGKGEGGLTRGVEQVSGDTPADSLRSRQRRDFHIVLPFSRLTRRGTADPPVGRLVPSATGSRPWQAGATQRP